ncbi:MAG: hypothetical protein H7843_04595 [Nitrospirota bacterium]
MIRLNINSYLVVIVIIYALLTVIDAGQCHGEDNISKKHLLKQNISPVGKTIIRYYVTSNERSSGDIWLYSTEDRSKKEFLFSFSRDAEVLISPDEKWLVINHTLEIKGAEAILFKKIKDLKYQRVKLLNPMAWALLKKTHKQIPGFGHSYTEALHWSSDSKSLMIELYGYDDKSQKALEPWYCIYDLTTGKMTLDFNRVFNRNTYHPNGKAKGRKLYKY